MLGLIWQVFRRVKHDKNRCQKWFEVASCLCVTLVSLGCVVALMMLIIDYYKEAIAVPKPSMLHYAIPMTTFMDILLTLIFIPGYIYLLISNYNNLKSTLEESE